VNSVVQSGRKRAAIYVRVSTAGQEQDGTSLVTQEAYCRECAGRRGYAIDEAHVYREVHTGTELWERAVLTRLREAIRRREMDCLVCYAIDRLARDPVHLGVILSEADHAGVEVLFVTEPLDNSPEGQLIRFVRGYAAKVEHEKFRERSMRGLRARLEAGKPHPGPKPPFGYLWRDEAKSAYVVDPDTVPTVQWIFRAAAAGQSLRQITGLLNERGVPSPTGRPLWRFSTIHTILSNPIYAGQASARRTVSTRNGYGRKTMKLRPEEEHVSLPEGTAPALVEASAFEAVQARMRLNKERAARNNHDPEAALLRGGYARCAHCGGALSARRTHSGRYLTYRCGRNMESRESCAGSSIQAATLDAAVWERVERLLTNPTIIAGELERMRTKDPTDADLAGIDRMIGQTERQQRGLVGHLAALDPDSAALVHEQLASLSARRRGLEDERQAVLGRRRAWELAQGRLDELEGWCATVAANLGELTYQQKRLALDTLGVSARVWRVGHEPRYQVEASIPLEGGAIVSNTR
jgi:site-specific DNA recombinase